jgi:uncharacterized protein (DUF1778 family)
MATPKGRGRPLDADKPRDQQRPVRFTADELESIERAAAAEGITVAAFIRRAAVRSAQRRNR